ncbi:MAG: phosphatidate cytidylyltransferase [Nitrospinae bacterium]|nr:phosphatidate cytidylyltransferase [Nitrospinota bacterium]
MTRFISGLALASLIIGVTLYGSPALFTAVTAFFAMACLVEFYGMLKAGGEPSMTGPGLITGLGVFTLASLGLYESMAAFIPLTIMLIFGCAVICSGVDNSYRSASNTVFGALYVGLTLATLPLIRQMPDGALLIIMLALANGFCDTFAYYTGRAIGKTPLMPKVSPKKTVEGFVGGFIGSMAGALGFAHFFLQSLGIVNVAMIGLIVGVVGPLGDLAESAIKRKMGVKDSGRLIPGHGGALDRLDSIMFTGPAILVYLLYVAGVR